jgi:hypothetical protein
MPPGHDVCPAGMATQHRDSSIPRESNHTFLRCLTREAAYPQALPTLEGRIPFDPDPKLIPPVEAARTYVQVCVVLLRTSLTNW